MGGRYGMRAIGWAVVIGLGLLAGPLAAAPRVTPSGLPVPRYVSLKFGKVNARSGPGEDHRLLWVYRAKGLPLQVVAETADWRQVCDPQGQLAWIHKRGADGSRTAMRTQSSPLPLRGRPEAQSRIEAYLRPQSIAAVDRCEEGWCRLKVQGVSGWVPEREIWGAAAGRQCR